MTLNPVFPSTGVKESNIPPPSTAVFACICAGCDPFAGVFVNIMVAKVSPLFLSEKVTLPAIPATGFSPKSQVTVLPVNTF